MKNGLTFISDVVVKNTSRRHYFNLSMQQLKEPLTESSEAVFFMEQNYTTYILKFFAENDYSSKNWKGRRVLEDQNNFVF